MTHPSAMPDFDETPAAVGLRVMPHDLSAERAVLGAVLLDGQRIADVGEVLAEGDFYRDAHRRIFRQMVALANRSTGVDFLTLKDALARAGDLDECGGPAYVAALADGIPRGTNVGEYAAIVKEKATLRSLIQSANTILTAAFEAEQDAADVVQDAERLIFQLATGGRQGGFVSMREIAQDGLGYLEQLAQSRNGLTGVPSGFADLDHITRGFQPGNLVIVAARPAMGKTALAVNVAQYAAKTGRSVGVFSLEMSTTELFIRQLAAEAHIDSHRMQSGHLGDRDWGRLSHAISLLAESSVHIDDSANIGVFEMRGRSRRLKAAHGLDLLIVDYLQLMTSPDTKRSENRTLELGAISRALKGLAKELQIPILALSQLSRAPETRSDHRPMLSDLRESGALEQDADLVLMLYRAAVYEETPENRNQAELIIAKHRAGPVGTVRLAWLPEETRFANYAEYQTTGAGDRRFQ